MIVDDKVFKNICHTVENMWNLTQLLEQRMTIIERQMDAVMHVNAILHEKFKELHDGLQQ